jgi:hypothetical protein
MRAATKTRGLRAVLPALAVLALFAAAAPRSAGQDSRRKQEIAFGELPARKVGDAPFDLSAKATSGLPVTFVLVSGPAVLDGRNLRLTDRPGLVVVRATQPGNGVFLPAVSAERAFTVSGRPSAPTITLEPEGSAVGIGDLVLLSADATGEPPPSFQWRKDGNPITGATQRQFSLASAAASDAGTYDVVATNPLGSSTSERARVTVGKRSQTISFQGATSAAAGQPVILNATASSGLPVRFDVVSGTATVNGAVLMSTLGGTVVVQATQAGDSNYEAATPVMQTFIITSGPTGQVIH